MTPSIDKNQQINQVKLTESNQIANITSTDRFFRSEQSACYAEFRKKKIFFVVGRTTRSASGLSRVPAMRSSDKKK